MTAKFERAFEDLIGIEGGYVFDPDDKGGETKFGISKRSYPHLDIKNLTLEQAKDIYYFDFWYTSRINLDLFPEKISSEIFDTSVNMGSQTARIMLQEALNLLNRVETRYPDLKLDGWIGEASSKAVMMVNKEELLKVLNGLQFMRYVEIVKNDHTQEKFFAGWITRT